MRTSGGILRYTGHGGGGEALVDDVEFDVGRERFGNVDKGLEHVLHDGEIRRRDVNGLMVSVLPMASVSVLLNSIG